MAYEVHERPGLVRVPLLDEETLFVSGPGGHRNKRRSRARSAVDPTHAHMQSSLDFAELAGYPLVMPGPRDGVRQQVLSTAKRLAISLNVILDVSSVSMRRRFSRPR